MGDQAKFIVRLGVVAAIVVMGVLLVVGLQRAMVGLGQLRNGSMTAAERLIDERAAIQIHTAELPNYMEGVETGSEFSPRTKWAQSVLCKSV